MKDIEQQKVELKDLHQRKNILKKKFLLCEKELHNNSTQDEQDTLIRISNIIEKIEHAIELKRKEIITLQSSLEKSNIEDIYIDLPIDFDLSKFVIHSATKKIIYAKKLPNLLPCKFELDFSSIAAVSGIYYATAVGKEKGLIKTKKFVYAKTDKKITLFVQVTASCEDHPGLKNKLTKYTVNYTKGTKTVNSAYKGINFDYQVNYEKVEHHNNNLSDGGHYQGAESSIEGMKIFYNQVTNKATNRLIYTFPTGRGINEWNDSVDESMSNINTSKSIVVGILSALIPWAEVATGAAFSVVVAMADNKLISLAAVEGGLNVGDSLVIESTIKAFRSTSGGGNGFEISLIIKIEDENGKQTEILAQDTITKEIDIFGSSNFNKAGDKLLRIIEDYKSSEVNVPPNTISAPLLIKFRRREE